MAKRRSRLPLPEVFAIFAITTFAVPAWALSLEEPADWRTVPDSPVLTASDREELERSRTVLLAEVKTLKGKADAFDSDCAREMDEDSPMVAECERRQGEIKRRIGEYRGYLAAYNERLSVERREHAAWKVPALVGGTTWTFGARLDCGTACRAEVTKQLVKQLELFCATNTSTEVCKTKPLTAKELPFNPDHYGLIVSVGSSHDPVQDIATRVLFDQVEFGKFSARNKEAFASLDDKKFEKLDCHSNGAMLCLAALRSGRTEAKQVRLFGPQMSEEAAKRWAELAKEKGIELTVYVANGDPVLGASWTLPPTKSAAAKAMGVAAQLAGPVSAMPAPAATPNVKLTGSENEFVEGAKRLVGAHFLPKQTDDAREKLKSLGVRVVTLPCADATEVNLDCHSAKRYDEFATRFEAGRAKEIQDGRSVKP